MIGGRHHVLRRHVQGAPVLRRERERRRAAKSIGRRRLIEHHDLTGDAIVASENVIPALRVHVAFVERVGDQETVLEAATRRPVVWPDHAEVAAARRAYRARILLRSADLVRKVVVRRDAIELPVDETVVRRERLAGVDRDRCALVNSSHHPFVVGRIDPEEARVCPTRRAPIRRHVLSGVGRSIHRRAHQIHDVRTLRIRVDLSSRARELPRSQRPRLAAVVGSIEASSAARPAPTLRQPWRRAGVRAFPTRQQTRRFALRPEDRGHRPGSTSRRRPWT